MRAFEIDEGDISQIAAELLAELTGADRGNAARMYAGVETPRRRDGQFYSEGELAAALPLALGDDWADAERLGAPEPEYGAYAAAGFGGFYPSARRRDFLGRRPGRFAGRRAVSGDSTHLTVSAPEAAEKPVPGAEENRKLPEMLSEKFCRDARRYDGAFRRY